MLSSLSIVVPAYNEEEGLANVVETILEVMPELALTYELIIVDDGSTDSTGAVAEQLAAKNEYIRVIHHERNRKMGTALRSGYADAKCEFVAPLTAARHISPGDLKRLFPLMQDADVVVGTWADLPYGMKRTVLHGGRIALARLLFGPHTPSAPIYMFRRELLKSVSLRSATGFLNVEFVLKMQRIGYRVRTVPVTWLSRRDSKSKSTNLRTIMMVVHDMFKVRLSL